MLRIRRVRHHLLDLVAAQNRGERLPLARRRDGEGRASASCGRRRAARSPPHCRYSTTAAAHAAGGPDTPGPPRRKCHRAAGDRTAPDPSRPRDRIRASARQTPGPPCRRPSVGATRSSHTSVFRRAEHGRSVHVDQRDCVCVAGIRGGLRESGRTPTAISGFVQRSR